MEQARSSDRFKAKGFSLPPELIAQIRAISRERGWNESMIAREALAGWLDQYEKTGQLSMKAA